MRRLTWCWLAASVGCGGSQSGTEGTRTSEGGTEVSAEATRAPSPPAAAVLKRSVTIVGERARGISGLDRYGDALIVAAERSKSAFIITADGDVREVPITGLPDELDIEGIATLDATRGVVLLSTESAGEHDAEALYVATLEDGRFTVGPPRRVQIDSASAGWSYTDNTGLEGVCVTDDAIWAAAEVAFERDGSRWAPIMRMERAALLGEGPLPASWLALRLSTDTGKIAGVDCADAESVTTLWAIERHFGVSRVLAARIPDGTKDGSIDSEVVYDLADRLPDKENFEGIVASDGQRFTLVNDNEYTDIRGDSALWTVEPAP